MLTISNAFLTIESTTYTYTDRPLRTRFSKGSLSVTTDHTYDAATGLLLKTRVTTDAGKGAAYTDVARYSYDDLGRVARVTRPGQAGETAYGYDVAGRIKTITGTLFSERLHYADGPGTPLYNGSISAMLWQAPDITSWRGYTLAYNRLGWLTDARYGEGETLSGNAGRYSVSVGEFTDNGCIRRLQRRGLKDDGNYGKVDNLHLRYDGNRLTEITEDAAAVTREGSNDFHPDKGYTATLTYNSTGALVSDTGRGISSITYDRHNRLRRISFGKSGDYITHTYSADGRRLRTVHNTSQLQPTGPLRPLATGAPSVVPPVTEYGIYVRDTLDYCGPVVYENGSVKRILFDGGYATLESDGTPTWHFYATDHLGNVRVVSDVWGRAEQINHYYPYGLTFADAGKGAGVQPCKHGGKELDAMYGLYWSDFGARHLSHQAACWTTMDPFCEKYYHLSPYLYCANNPFNLIDPDGREIEYLDTDLEKIKSLKTIVQDLRNNSQIFNKVYDCLDASSEVITVGFGITSDIDNENKASGEYRVNENEIVFDISRESPSYAVISEEFYHAYQEENKYLNIVEWNREFEAKVVVSAICSEAGKGLFLFDNMEKFTTEIFLNRQDFIFRVNFDNNYKLYGNQFANSYQNISNYNIPVNFVPITLKMLLK